MHSPWISGSFAALDKSVEKKLQNIKLIREDATYLSSLITLFQINSTRCVSTYFFQILGRKIVNTKGESCRIEFVEIDCPGKLKPNGYIHIATDWQPYADWIKVRFDANQRV